eukprot:6736744-Pyramimonas_sp.AAC.2
MLWEARRALVGGTFVASWGTAGGHLGPLSAGDAMRPHLAGSRTTACKMMRGTRRQAPALPPWASQHHGPTHPGGH